MFWLITKIHYKHWWPILGGCFQLYSPKDKTHIHLSTADQCTLPGVHFTELEFLNSSTYTTEFKRTREFSSQYNHTSDFTKTVSLNAFWKNIFRYIYFSLLMDDVLLCQRFAVTTCHSANGSSSIEAAPQHPDEPMSGLLKGLPRSAEVEKRSPGIDWVLKWFWRDSNDGIETSTV